MDPLWTEFRSGPTAYLQAHKMTMDTLITNMIQVRAAWDCPAGWSTMRVTALVLCLQARQHKYAVVKDLMVSAIENRDFWINTRYLDVCVICSLWPTTPPLCPDSSLSTIVIFATLVLGCLHLLKNRMCCSEYAWKLTQNSSVRWPSTLILYRYYLLTRSEMSIKS